MRHLIKIQIFVLLFAVNFVNIHAAKLNTKFLQIDSVQKKIDLNAIQQALFYSNIDTVKNDSSINAISKRYKYTLFADDSSHEIRVVDDATFNHRIDSIIRSKPLSREEYLLYHSNPLTLPLVFTGIDFDSSPSNFDFLKLKPWALSNRLDTLKPSFFETVKIVNKLRNDARAYLANNALDLYATNIDQLPALSSFMISEPIKRKRLHALHVYDDTIKLSADKIRLENVKLIYWRKRATGLLQFSQNYISSNWYQGGNSNLAFLSIFNGEVNYDNLKNIQWENKIEWRLGVNSVDGDTIRKFSVNDDVLRYLTKFGIKAGGNWYYSISGDFSTQLFNNYKGMNSKEFKARLFTPVRANIGIGMDYKYKKIFSLMIAPITFKYIYMNDTVNVNPNLFGIKKGENQLEQLGSSFLAQLHFSPLLNWNIDSKLTFYTDYNKMTIDWETVNTFTINRFLTTRLSINPRYDSTIILPKGEKVDIQFKELLSIGFAYRFI